ncbi:S1 family peptidase [Cryptosporangium aurantiacum]|uniref:Streptogrisin D n=1 Tax=Cryptosporangium aurantiacum TaxID=134849 RepID=A0A1M7NJX7_9ACTN|nr:S1 family peptidase [Cryptosporangium aurantiacum]SHN04152.1 streptogrisin D [Cryptosporangium aurantiacum]
MPTPRHRRAPSASRRTATITSVLAGAVAAALAAFLATAPTAGATDAARPAKETTDTGPSAYSPAIKQIAVRALAAELGISEEDAEARLAQLDSRTRTAVTIQSALGSRVAGTWLSRTTGDLMVNVTDQDAADVVEDAGGTARLVSRSLPELQQIQAQLDAISRIPGTAWTVDAASNTVTVQVSDTAAADSRADAWLEKLEGYGDAVRVQRTTATFTTQAFFGGQAILNAAGGGRCTSAFNATDGQNAVVITAGHCTEAVQTWTDGQQVIGQSDLVEFPGNDYGTIEVDDPQSLDPQPAVINQNQLQPITGATLVPVGSPVCKTGSTTGTTCGVVQAYNTTVVYPEGQVRGLTQTDLCTQPGDSGGALFAGDQAQGIVSGGTNGGCDTFGFTSFFQPIDEVLADTGLQLIQ